MAWADAKTAVGGGGSFGNDAYQLSIGLFRDGPSAGFAQVGTHINSKAMSSARHQNPSFRSKKLILRELDRPLRRLPKPRANPPSTKSRCAVTPSRVTRQRRLIKLSSSKRLMCLPLKKKRYEDIVSQSSFKASGAAAARPSCMLLGGSSPFQSRRTWISLSYRRAKPLCDKVHRSRQHHSKMHP